jgi:hypothetical protein
MVRAAKMVALQPQPAADEPLNTKAMHGAAAGAGGSAIYGSRFY